MLKIGRAGLYNELFYAIIPTLFLFSCCISIPTSPYNFNGLCFIYHSFVSSRCMLELNFVIYHRAARGLSSRASQASVQASSQCGLRKCFLLMHTDRISNSLLLSNDYVSLLTAKCFVRMHKNEEKGVPSKAIVLE